MAFDLSDPVRAMREMAQAIFDLQTATPLANASIGRGTLTVYDGGIILIDNGGLKIVGWADIIGSLEVTGQINGTGDLNWAGKAFLDGPVEITDTLKVLAVTTLLSDLTLDDDGRIIVGKMRIDPTVGQGAVVFENGAQVFSDADTIQVYKGNSVAQIADGYARLQSGGVALTVENGKGIRMTGVPKKTGTGLPSGAIGRDSTGYLYEAQ